MTTPDALLLAPGARLLHVGPHKTGTTALQGALHQARSDLRRHDVVYAGRERQQYNAALAVAGRTFPHDMDRHVPIEYWDRLVAEVGSVQSQRVVISSEVFCEADPATIRTVVSGLGGDRVHVLVTLRPLAKILPSSWQQFVRNRMQLSYDEWLELVFSATADETWSRWPFWLRHRHEHLIERWVRVVGPDRVHVLMIDDADRLGPVRVVERMTGLPEGLLRAADGRANRSLTAGEVESLRYVNRVFNDRGVPDETYRQVVAIPFVRTMQKRMPSPEEAGIVTPAWALDEAARRGAVSAQAIRDLGVRVIGDLDLLAIRPPDVSAPEQADVPSAEVAQFLTRAIAAAAHGVPAFLPRTAAPHETGQGVLSRELVVELARRLVQRARRRGASKTPAPSDRPRTVR